jgi:quercetin dioxygenase-like cupin family protein
MQTTVRTPWVVPPNGGRKLHALGVRFAVKVSGTETGDAFSVAELEVPPGVVLPPHVHSREEETLYLLEGALEIHCGGRRFTMRKGSMVVLPRHIPHGIRNPADALARVLVTLTPARGEGFIEELGTLAAEQSGELEKLSAIGRKYGVEFLPPSAGVQVNEPAPGGVGFGGLASNRH